MKPKCVKCGGDLGKSFMAFATKTCPKCAGLDWPTKMAHPIILPPSWDGKLELPDYYIPHLPTDHNDDTGSWWTYKTEFFSFPKESNIHQTIGIPPLPGEIDFDDGYNSDETLAALGRAFDDAIDLAYLG